LFLYKSRRIKVKSRKRNGKSEKGTRERDKGQGKVLSHFTSKFANFLKEEFVLNIMLI